MAEKPVKPGKGRPTKYDKKYAEQAEKLCLLGATDIDLSKFFNVTESTINLWKLKHKDFSESLKKGKEIADMKVVESLYKRATGYEESDDMIFQYQGQPVIVPYKKKIGPDPTSCIFWLKNRQPKSWRDKQSQELTGPDGQPLIPTVIEIRGYKGDGSEQQVKTPKA